MINAFRATYVEEQDCRLVQDLIKKANDLMSSMTLSILERADRFIAPSIMKKRMVTLAESIKEVYTNITKQH
jgi:hypothetical protein